MINKYIEGYGLQHQKKVFIDTTRKLLDALERDNEDDIKTYIGKMIFIQDQFIMFFNWGYSIYKRKYDLQTKLDEAIKNRPVKSGA